MRRAIPRLSRPPSSAHPAWAAASRQNKHFAGVNVSISIAIQPTGYNLQIETKRGLYIDEVTHAKAGIRKGAVGLDKFVVTFRLVGLWRHKFIAAPTTSLTR